MAIVRWRPFGQMSGWDPYRETTDIQSEMMNRLFDVFGRPAQAGGAERVWAPPVDMYETRDELVINAELSGVNEKDVHLSMTGDVLMLNGERALTQDVKQENCYRGERWYGKFERSLPLPFPVQADKAKATFRDGVLTVKLPKADEIKPKEIKIDVV